MIKKLAFLIILFFAVALRSQETISHNFLFLIDQGRDMMEVKHIMYDHHLTLIGPYTSLGGIFQGPLWYYLLAIPTVLTNGDPWGGVLLMLFISVATAVLAYFLTYRTFGFKTAIITFLLFATCPELIAAATYVWNPHPNWLLLVVYVFSLYFVSLGKRKYHLLLWPTIAFMFHFETALGVFILVATFLYVLLFYRKQILHKYFFIGLLLAGVFFLPQIVFDIRHNFLMTRSVLSLFTGQDRGLVVGGESRNYGTIIVNHINAFRVNFNSSFIQDGMYKEFPSIMLFLLIFIFVVVKQLKLLDKTSNFFITTIFKMIGLVFLVSCLYPFPIRAWYLTGFEVFYLFIAGVLLSAFYKHIVGKIIVFGLVIVFLGNSFGKLDRLYVHPANDGGVAKIKGKKDAIDFIYNDAKQKPFGLLVFAPPVYTYNYDYLIFWLSKTKYHYTPHKEKKGVFYLLMEPDSSKPWSYQGWLDTVIKSGKVLYKKELPSGLIVEKRVEESEKRTQTRLNSL